MIVLLAIGTALAGPPRVGAQGLGLVRGEGDLGLGARATIGLPIGSYVEPELAADFAAGAASSVSARLGLRLWSDAREEGVLGVLLAAGADSDRRGTEALGHVGIGLRAPGPWRLQWTVDAGVDLRSSGVDAVRFGFGARIGERVEEPVVEPEVIEPEVLPPPEETIPLVEVDPPDAQVWIPHPICAWAPASEAGPLLARYGGEQPIEVRAPGYLPAELGPEGGAVVLERAPEQGSVIVAGWPGDRVVFGDETVVVDERGVAVLTVPTGPVSLVAEGYGREAELDGYVTDGNALWLRLADPEPLLLMFGVNSSAVTPRSQRELAAFAEHLADGRVSVTGGSSPEGNQEANRVLAERRARAVYDALVALGVPEEQLVLGESEVAEGPPGPQQRRVLVRPLRGSR